ncbi:hypothetical protein Dsin_016505 [Dipteronia sinensis]|uniref:Chloroplast lumen common family protein n=1 Tax=Dipteronia sinensis TaxID=43782 RepID=A0AAE0ADH8_9ROSI|nr:hypothetical protein Dsin_016505 [Dipteronia sinensis]
MSSIKTLSLYLQSESPHLPRFTNLNKSPPSISIPLHHKHKPHRLLIQPTKPLSAFSITPTSGFSSHNRFLEFLKEKAVVFVVGSFIFLGCFGLNARPSLALPYTMSEAGESPEEKRENTQMGKTEEELCEKILETEPRNVEALKMIVHGKMRRGKTKEAVEYVERLIDIEPKEVEWRLLQALCYELTGQLSKAKRLFKEILRKRPLLLRALHGLALVMHKNHEGPAVFQMLTSALEVACRQKRVTEERNIKLLIAQMHVVKGELEEGLKKFQDLINENPRDFRPYLCQGIIYSLLDKKREAAEQFEIYQSLVPEEFPQRGFMDNVSLAAKTKSRERLQKEFEAEFSYKK